MKIVTSKFSNVCARTGLTSIVAVLGLIAVTTGVRCEAVNPKAESTAGSLKTPILGLYGEKDQGIPLDTVEKMRAALKQAGNQSEIIVFPDAPHGFHADYRASYRADAAKDAWSKLLKWFQQYGVA